MQQIVVLRTIAVAMAATFVLSGCSQGTGGPAAGDASGPLIVYSNSVSDGRGEWLVEKAATAGFEIEFVDMGGGDVQNRIVAEVNNPIADVVFGPNNVVFENMKAADALEPYTPEWAGLVDATVADGDDENFWPIVKEPIMLVYDSAAYPGGEGAPEDWTDLWEKEEFHGLYETSTSLSGGTTQMVVTGILTRYQDEAGYLGISDEGWTAIEQFYANGSPSVEATDLYARMADESVTMGQMWLAGKVSREEEYGVTTKAVYPEVGVPIVYQHIGLVAGNDKPEASREFIDWFGSAPVQAEWSQEFFTAPTNEDALTGADAAAVEVTNSFAQQDIDWEFVAANLPSWVEEIELKYLGQ
ncbi:extracellular solute-binding protein [Cryobacterium sp. SO1]|uniref:extracellular solute-binding protein n=1 Tax=Cryobacterium sp. SO1 TaxID=1897061 RepID=UPI00102387B5|nr:extracellular solute-binding protein [Cryobacterium sp. SO1]RZI37209.1 hypothetical protein BJQ95_00376 [Cryobacterium sp. SO1]